MKKWLMIPAILILIAIIVFIFVKIRTVEDIEIPDTAGQIVNVSPEEFQTPRVVADSGSPASTLKGVTNILVCGVDNYDADSMEERGNSDGIMLLTLNADTKEFILTSFMRDSKVKVNDYKRDKLTHVYHDDGLEALISVLESNFEISVDYYAIFNFLDVADIVDSVGGVEINLAEEEIYSLEPKIRNVCSMKNVAYEDYKLTKADAGKRIVNGIQAAAYARIRPEYGHYDVGRTERCRTIVYEVLKKVSEMSMQEMLPFADVFLKKTNNNISDELLMSIVNGAEEIKSYKLISDRIPIDGAYQSQNDGNGSYIIPDFEINNKHLKDSIYKGIH